MWRLLFLAAAFVPMFFYALMLFETIAFYKPDATFQSALVVLEHFIKDACLVALGAAVVGALAVWVQTSTEGWPRARVIGVLSVYAGAVMLQVSALLKVCYQNASNVPADAVYWFMVLSVVLVASLYVLSKDADAGPKKRVAIVLMLAAFFLLPIAGMLMIWFMMSDDAQPLVVILFILFFAGMQGLAGFAIDRVRAMRSEPASPSGSRVFEDIIDEHS